MARQGSNIQHNIQGVFIFVLLGLFALMATLIVVLGAQMYRATVNDSTQNNDYRVLNSYVRSMIRAEDTIDAVSVETRDNIKTLALKESVGPRTFVTWIYAYNGDLYELFTDYNDESFDPEFGDPICPVNDFDPSIDGNLVTVHMQDANNEPCDVQVALRCAESGQGDDNAQQK